MINTNYGKLEGESFSSFYEDGSVKCCKLEVKNTIVTSIGKLIPKYQLNETRTRDRSSVEFYPSGVIKNIYLDSATNVITPIGIISGEFITFYESGSIHRLFPTYGKPSGTWSEEEEINLAPMIKIDLDVVQINNKLSCICFYDKGSIRSITLYTGETAICKVNGGEIETRFGVAFYENGKVQSIEPETSTLITTSIGMIIAFDNNPIGVHGDSNSLVFDEEGEVTMVTTIQTGIEVKDKSGEILHIAAISKPSLLNIDVFQMYSIKIVFTPEGITVTDSNEKETFYDYKKYEFSTFYNMLYKSDECSSGCSSCSGCH